MHRGRGRLLPTAKLTKPQTQDLTPPLQCRSELARHEIWRTKARLESLLGDIALEDDPAELSARINAAIERLVSFSDKLEKKSP